MEMGIAQNRTQVRPPPSIASDDELRKQSSEEHYAN